MKTVLRFTPTPSSTASEQPLRRPQRQSCHGQAGVRGGTGGEDRRADYDEISQAMMHLAGIDDGGLRRVSHPQRAQQMALGRAPAAIDDRLDRKRRQDLVQG